jgi:oligosaccharide repeat unit polymerase
MQLIHILLLLSLLIFSVIWSISYSFKYQTALNPATSFVGFDIFIIGILPLGYLEWNHLYQGSEEGIFKVEVMLAMYFVGFLLGAFSMRKSIVNFFFKLYNSINISYSGRKISIKLIIIMLFTLSLVSFIALSIIGGGGLKWIFDVRDAYIQNRAGAGIFWLMMQWNLQILLIICLLYFKPERMLALLGVLCLFIGFNYFSGSKSNMLSVMVTMIVYYNFYIKRFSIMQTIRYVFVVLISFSIILTFQSDAAFKLVNIINYFKEYAFVTIRYMSNEFLEFGYGVYMLSDLWYYVPRIIVPEKPFEYGVLHVHQVLFPGAAEEGNTPGVYNWLLYYLDFGSVGVFVAGFFRGFFTQLIFNIFLKDQNSPVMFLLMLHLCIYHVFALSSFVTLSMIVIQVLLLSKFVSLRRRA